MGVTEHELRQAAYLIYNKVRPLASYACWGSKHEMEIVRQTLNRAAQDFYEIIPFVSIGTTAIKGKRIIEFGYAARGWVLDLCKYLDGDKNIPEKQRERIWGLLHGYGIDAIARFDERQSGRLLYPINRHEPKST